jgi:hypothetical protein
MILGPGDAAAIGAALQRNTNILRLCIEGLCGNVDFRPILSGVASTESKSKVQWLALRNCYADGVGALIDLPNIYNRIHCCALWSSAISQM